QVRVALEQRAVVEGRHVLVAHVRQALPGPVRGNDGADLDLAAAAGKRADPAEQRVQPRAAGVGHLLRVIEPNRFAVIDPFERHARYVGSEYLLRNVDSRPSSHTIDPCGPSVRFAGRPRKSNIGTRKSRFAIAFRYVIIRAFVWPRRDRRLPRVPVVPRPGETTMPLTIGVLRETLEGETRVALTPEVAARLRKAGVTLVMERGAGTAAGLLDEAYEGVELADADAVLARAGVLFTVQPARPEAVAKLAPGSVVVGFMHGHVNRDLVAALRDHRLTGFAMELIPRISRAQSMDALSSQAAAAGYRA